MRTNNMKFETSEKIVLRFAWGFASSVLLLLLVGLLLLVMGFAGASFAQEYHNQERSRLQAKRVTLSFRLPKRRMSRPWKRSSEQERKSLRRATKSRTSSNASSSAKNTRRCTVWSESPTEARCCTSAQKTGPFPIPSGLKERRMVLRFRDRYAGNYVPKNRRE